MLSITCLDENGNLVTNLTQWDKNQVLVIKGINLTDVPEIHFCNKNSREAFVVMPTIDDDGAISVKIPNCFLQEALPLYVYLYVYSTEVSGKTIETIKIPIRKRTKPSDYVYEENVSIVSTVPILIEMLDTPPLPSAGARGLFPKEDGWYDYDETGNVTRIATSAELKKISENSKLVVEETVNSGVAKSYVLKQGEIVIASIDIPLDMVVSGGAVETYTNDNLPPTVENPGTYIVLTIANSTSDKLYININDLVEINEIADDLVTDDSNKVLSAKQGKILNDTKVDKVDGKDLSANDFTDELKSKLENIDENATKYVHPETHPADMITGLSDVATSGSYNDLTDTPESIYLVDEEGTLYLPEGDYRPAIKGDSVHIRYSENSDGTDFTTTWSKRQCYLGIYVGQVAPTEKEAYQWVLFREDMKPVSTIPSTLETNTSYNFGEVTELNLSFPTDAIDGDIIYITFTSGATATNLIVDTTNTSDFELIPEVNSGYEICGKFNGVLWILSDFEYTYTVA